MRNLQVLELRGCTGLMTADVGAIFEFKLNSGALVECDEEMDRRLCIAYEARCASKS